MAGQLVQVATNTVTSAVASVTLTGIDSDDVYMVAYNNVLSDTDARYLTARVTVGGTADTNSNYDRRIKTIIADSAFGTDNGTNQTYFLFEPIGTGNKQTNAILYLFNFNNSSEYSFMTVETATQIFTGSHRTHVGGMVNKVNQSCDGIEFSISSGNIASGTFTLYRVV
jgi:cytochrome c-type biogenesis protein CcmE